MSPVELIKCERSDLGGKLWGSRCRTQFAGKVDRGVKNILTNPVEVIW